MSHPAKNVLPLAYSTAIFYTLLALVSGWFYRKFALICDRNKSGGGAQRSHLGKFDEAKTWFFLLLTLSAIADIPLFVGCIVQNGPHDCEWDGGSYAVFWFLHLCAVCGYTYTIIIPCLLWSDMINKKDGKLFTSKYPVDKTKRLFQVALLCFIGLTICDIIFGGIYYKVSDHGSYNGNYFHMMCALLQPIFICAIALGCLWSGIRLQTYVRQAKLGFKTEIRFLFHMNVTMVIITSTYMARALLTLQFVTFLPANFRSALKTTYFVWLLCTRWLPYIFCSFCLSVMMRASGEEVAKRRGSVRTKSTASSAHAADSGDFDETPQRKESTGVLHQLTKFPAALVSAIYQPSDDYHTSSHHVRVPSAASGANELSESLMMDYYEDEAEYSHAYLSGNPTDERTLSVSSSRPSSDLGEYTPQTTPVVRNKLIPPHSNSSMYTGYSPPPPQSLWAQARNTSQSPATADGRLLHTTSPALTASNSTPSTATW